MFYGNSSYEYGSAGIPLDRPESLFPLILPFNQSPPTVKKTSTLAADLNR